LAYKVLDNKVLEQLNKGNSEAICAKISEDAEKEAKSIIESGRSQVENILLEARRLAEAKKQEIFKELDQELSKSREKVSSSLNLARKRLILAEKDKFVQSVLAEVREKALVFRHDPGYPEFLGKAVVEAIKIVGDKNTEVYYSYLDEQLFNEGFMKNIKNSCPGSVNNGCSIKFSKSDFTDLGVIVNAPGGRIIFDNRFLTRLERAKEEIYMDLLKGSFKD
jgi:vacuolar-type H+-ATPase subunit E/Vma4